MFPIKWKTSSWSVGLQIRLCGLALQQTGRSSANQSWILNTDDHLPFYLSVILKFLGSKSKLLWCSQGSSIGSPLVMQCKICLKLPCQYSRIKSTKVLCAKKTSLDGVTRIVGINFGWGGATFLSWHLTAGQELPQVVCQLWRFNVIPSWQYTEWQFNPFTQRLLLYILC